MDWPGLGITGGKEQKGTGGSLFLSLPSRDASSAPVDDLGWNVLRKASAKLSNSYSISLASNSSSLHDQGKDEEGENVEDVGKIYSCPNNE